MSKHDLLIIGSNNKSTGGIPRYIPEQLEHLPNSVDSSVFDVGAPEGAGIVWFLKSFVLSVFDAFRFPFRPRPEVVHVHSSQQFSFYRASFYVLFTTYIWRRPVILHIHGSSFDEFVTTDSVISRFIQSIVYAAATRIIVLSEYWKEQLGPYTDPEKITIIPNAVDPDDYAPEYDHETRHVIFLSNLIERKGVNEFVTAVENILETQSNLQISIAGKGPLSKRVEKLESKSNSVAYLGYVTEAEKYDLLSKGSIYVLPAYAEGLPIAILESMAGGNAVVSTTVGSVPEIIDDENGRLVSPRDAEELANVLEDLILSPDTVEEMGRNNRRLVEERYCWDKVAGQLVNQYETVTQER
ncbi:glycosyl transferase [Halorubrum ezzemoulense]|nr:glycosyl transferase [Halorubrum ezzemoulense]